MVIDFCDHIKVRMSIFYDYGDRIAAIEENGNQISYAEIFEVSQKIRKIVPDRCLVFQLCTNSIGSIVGYVSFQINQIVPLMLSSELDDELREYLIETYRPSYMWIPKEKEDEFVKFEVVFEAYNYVLVKTELTAYSLFDELGLLLTTSGSTGSPKLVRQSYKNIAANTKSIVEYLELDENERPITTLPMNYTYGLSIINTHLSVGATLLLTNSTLFDKSFWNFFKEESATSLAGVPYTYEMLAKLRFFRMDLPSLKTMTQAGGKLNAEMHKKFAEYAQANGKKFIVMYGQTEATARMAYLPFEKSIEKYGSMGIAIPGGKFQLFDSSRNVITEPGVMGELIYSGENVTLGYAECGADLARGDERFGVLETGDMAKFDEDGYFYIVGRKKRFLKIFGNRVNLDETERILKSEFQEYSVACSGKDDKMYIFVSSEAEVNLNAIKMFISEKTKLNISAFEVIQIDSIPKNDSGKTLYVELEKYVD